MRGRIWKLTPNGRGQDTNAKLVESTGHSLVGKDLAIAGWGHNLGLSWNNQKLYKAKTTSIIFPWFQFPRYYCRCKFNGEKFK